MTAKRFEDLYCWQQSRILVNIVYQLTRQKKFFDFSLRDQIQRAAVSVMSNIAEGFEKGTDKELSHAFYISKGSCGEVRSQAYTALDQNFISTEEFNKLKSVCEQTSISIYRMIKSL